MNETIVKHIDIAFEALQDISFHVLELEQRLEQLETENQNLAEQIVELEQENGDLTRDVRRLYAKEDLGYK